MGPVSLGFLASLIAGGMTALGAVPVLFGRSVSQRGNDALLGFAAGVMLAATVATWTHRWRRLSP